MENKIITIIGSAYFEPIALLLERLENEPNNTSTRPNGYVNGFAVSVCVLSVMCLESHVMRAKYIKLNKTNINAIEPFTNYLKDNYENFPFQDESNEIYMVRNAIAHNHLWEEEYSLSENGKIYTTHNKNNAGTSTHKENINADGLTLKLGLNTNPTRINALDAKTVIKNVWNILLFLENEDINQCSVSSQRVRYKENPVALFGDVVMNYLKA